MPHDSLQLNRRGCVKTASGMIVKAKLNRLHQMDFDLHGLDNRTNIGSGT
jgi:hypothetical protein